MNSKLKYYFLLFCVGGTGYCFLELLWRGYTHPSMYLAGGTAFCMMSVIQKQLKPLRFVYRCIASGLTITLIELVFGGIFNIWLGRGVWDYSMLPLNLAGQVCLLYAVLWCFLSAPMLVIADLLRQRFLNNTAKATNHNDADAVS